MTESTLKRQPKADRKPKLLLVRPNRMLDLDIGSEATIQSLFLSRWRYSGVDDLNCSICKVALIIIKKRVLSNEKLLLRGERKQSVELLSYLKPEYDAVDSNKDMNDNSVIHWPTNRKPKIQIST